MGEERGLDLLEGIGMFWVEYPKLIFSIVFFLQECSTKESMIQFKYVLESHMVECSSESSMHTKSSKVNGKSLRELYNCAGLFMQTVKSCVNIALCQISPEKVMSVSLCHISPENSYVNITLCHISPEKVMSISLSVIYLLRKLCQYHTLSYIYIT